VCPDSAKFRKFYLNFIYYLSFSKLGCLSDIFLKINYSKENNFPSRNQYWAIIRQYWAFLKTFLDTLIDSRLRRAQLYGGSTGKSGPGIHDGVRQPHRRRRQGQRPPLHRRRLQGSILQNSISTKKLFLDEFSSSNFG
jgi:hypothetical protein